MDLLENPFYILGASTTDDTARIRDLAKSNASGLSREALSELEDMLIDPYKRLKCELCWLPGVEKDQIETFLDRLKDLIQKNETISLSETLPFGDMLNPLSRVNILITIIKHFQRLDATFIREVIYQIFQYYDLIDHQFLFSKFNKDRQLANINRIYQQTEILSLMPVNRDYYVSVIKEVFDRMGSKDLIIEINRLTDNFQIPSKKFPQLLNELIYKFEFEAEDFFEIEEGNLKKLVECLEESLQKKYPEAVIDYIVKKIVSVFNNWESVFHSIHKYYIFKSEEHPGCLRVYKQIRDVSLLMSKKYKRFNSAIQLLASLKNKLNIHHTMNLELSEDMKYIVGARDFFTKNFKWYLSYQTDKLEETSGSLGGSLLVIDEEGVKFNGKKCVFPKISGLRWGKVTENIGNKYNPWYKVIIKEDDNSNSIELDLDNEKLYLHVVNRLWTAVGGRIIYDMINEFKSGKTHKLKNLIIADKNLIQKYSDAEKKLNTAPFRWRQIKAINENDILKIVLVNNYFYLAETSFLDQDNLNVLQIIIQMAQDYNCEKLSDLLNIT
jgi:hypothetical protein